MIHGGALIFEHKKILFFFLSKKKAGESGRAYPNPTRGKKISGKN